MRKRLTAVALAGTVGLGAVGAAAYPAFADNGSVTKVEAGRDQRAAAIKEALKGLVADKTLTQAQADKVAETLSQARAGHPFAGPGGPGERRAPGWFGPGGGLLGVEGPQADAAAAKVLGLSVADLRAALESGSTLADLAKKQGKDVEPLVDALVTVAKQRLAESVKAGRLSQETADRIEKTLEQRVRTVVQNGRPEMGMRMRWHPRGQKDDGTAPRPAPPARPGTPQPAPSARPDAPARPGTPPAPPQEGSAPPAPGGSAESSVFTDA
jgi:hypothetical protein